MPRSACLPVPRFFQQCRVTFLFARKPKVQIGISRPKLRQVLPAQEIMHRLVVAFPHFDQMLRQFMRRRMATLQINRKVAAFSAQPVRVLIQRFEQFEYLAQLLERKLCAVLQVS